MGTLATLAHYRAFRTTVKEVEDTAANYKTELLLLINYAVQVKAYKLPILYDPSTWPGGKDGYQQSLTAWANTTGRLQAWAMSTLKNVVAMPQLLINNSTQIIVPTLSAAVDISKLLIKDPKNPTLKASLMNNLHLLSINFTQFSAMTQPLITSLQSQATVFDQDAKTMTDIAAQALKTAGVDKTKIQDLTQKIQQLSADITARSWAIAAGAIITLAGIGIGILAFVLAPFSGGVSLTLLIPAAVITAGGAVVIGLNAKGIADDKAAIDAANSQINSYQADIALLQLMSQTLGDFASKVGALKSALSIVVQPWQSAEKYFIETIKVLHDIEEATSEDWQQISAELQDILDHWNSLVVTMKGLVVDAHVAGADLKVGMTESEVLEAMNKAGKVSFADYLMAA